MSTNTKLAKYLLSCMQVLGNRYRIFSFCHYYGVGTEYTCLISIYPQETHRRTPPAHLTRSRSVWEMISISRDCLYDVIERKKWQESSSKIIVNSRDFHLHILSSMNVYSISLPYSKVMPLVFVSASCRFSRVWWSLSPNAVHTGWSNASQLTHCVQRESSVEDLVYWPTLESSCTQAYSFLGG